MWQSAWPRTQFSATNLIIAVALLCTNDVCIVWLCVTVFHILSFWCYMLAIFLSLLFFIIFILTCSLTLYCMCVCHILNKDYLLTYLLTYLLITSVTDALFSDTDDALFSRVLANKDHVLQPYLPDRPSTQYTQLNSTQRLFANNRKYIT